MLNPGKKFHTLRDALHQTQARLELERIISTPEAVDDD
jgi:hypothetical protein